MKLKKLYEAVVAKGIEADPRGKETVMESLEKKEKVFSGPQK